MLSRGRICAAVGVLGAGVLTCTVAVAQPVNDLCANATLTALNVPIAGTAVAATSDGSSRCSLPNTPDVYHRFTTGSGGQYTLSLCAGTTWDTVLSVHRGCPATGSDTDPSTDNQVGCNDDGCGTDVGVPSVLRVFLAGSTSYVVRISGYDVTTVRGAYSLLISSPPDRTGACCVLSACSLQTQSACLGAGGTYSGDFTACQTPSGSTQSFALASGLPATIVNASTITRTINVPASFTVADVRVLVGLSHPYSSDLTLRLTKGTTTATLVRRVGLGTSYEGLDLSGAYTFSDAGTQTLWEAAQALPLTASVLVAGTYQAADALDNATSLRQTFAGVAAQGDWTLTIIDSDPTDSGTLSSFSLVLEPSTGERCAAPAGACCSGVRQGGVGTTCSVLTATQCAALLGSFRGAGTACGASAGNPVTCCRANFDQTGGVNIDDIFIFLNAWFAGNISTDFDGNTVVNIDDIFIFLNSWFIGCPG